MTIILDEGHAKGVSNYMRWKVLNGMDGYTYEIERRVIGATVNSLKSQRQVEYTARDKHGTSIHIPQTVRKHEKSIARWLIEQFG